MVKTPINFIDMTGKKYGYLNVIRRAPRPKNSDDTDAYWFCKCDCGKTVILRGTDIRKNRKYCSRSCIMYYQSELNKYYNKIDPEIDINDIMPYKRKE